MTITHKPVDNGVNTEALIGARNALTGSPPRPTSPGGRHAVGPRHPQHVDRRRFRRPRPGVNHAPSSGSRSTTRSASHPRISAPLRSSTSSSDWPAA